MSPEKERIESMPHSKSTFKSSYPYYESHEARRAPYYPEYPSRNPSSPYASPHKNDRYASGNAASG